MLLGPVQENAARQPGYHGEHSASLRLCHRRESGCVDSQSAGCSLVALVLIQMSMAAGNYVPLKDLRP